MLDPPHAVICQLKITLRGISPLIWRRLLVSADTSIVDLHHRECPTDTELRRRLSLWWGDRHGLCRIHGQPSCQQALRQKATDEVVTTGSTPIVTDAHACPQRWTPANLPAI